MLEMSAFWIHLRRTYSFAARRALGDADQTGHGAGIATARLHGRLALGVETNVWQPDHRRDPVTQVPSHHRPAGDALADQRPAKGRGAAAGVRALPGSSPP